MISYGLSIGGYAVYIELSIVQPEYGRHLSPKHVVVLYIQ
jgi:hypothetical protein